MVLDAWPRREVTGCDREQMGGRLLTKVDDFDCNPMIGDDRVVPGSSSVVEGSRVWYSTSVYGGKWLGAIGDEWEMNSGLTLNGLMMKTPKKCLLRSCK
jgi:hypothetical protein